MSRTISLREANQTFARCIREVEGGAEYVITRNGEPVARLVRHSHERWDGLGYPDAIAGEAIPLGSRIVFVCSAFHDMTSDRPHHAALERSDALVQLERGAGTQFDPSVVAAFCAEFADERGTELETAAEA